MVVFDDFDFVFLMKNRQNISEPAYKDEQAHYKTSKDTQNINRLKSTKAETSKKGRTQKASKHQKPQNIKILNIKYTGPAQSPPFIHFTDSLFLTKEVNWGLLQQR